MPRRTNANMSKKRSASSTSERRESSGRKRQATRDVDALVLSLREGGNSYSAIARRLELGRATDAHQSFLRAIRAHEGAERERLVKGEEARLDRLEQRIRHRDADAPDKIERRLTGVDKFREAIRR
jgi:hypothetical protein